MRGKWGSLIAVLVTGVGLVLFLLGFDGHTTEALPFGIAALIAGVLLGLPSLRALRGAMRELDDAAPGEHGSGARALTGGPPPVSIACSNCGAAARLRLDQPTHADCEHCQHRVPLAPALVQQLTDAALAVKAQAQAERQIAEVITSLPAREASLGLRLRRVTFWLTAAAVLVGVFGFLRRYVDDSWHGFLLFALSAGPAALLLGWWTIRTVPRVVLGVVSHWTALRLPGQAGLACRACGAPLPTQVAPVLRCEYCGADSLASPALLERVEQISQHARRSVLGVSRQSRQADELAAFAVLSFPLVVLLGWFAIGAAAGGVVLRALSDLPLPASDEATYAIVDGCIVGVELHPTGGATLHPEAGKTEEVAVAPATRPISALVGLRLSDGATITRVWRRLSAPGRPVADTDTAGVLYLPGPHGGGGRSCLRP